MATQLPELESELQQLKQRVAAIEDAGTLCVRVQTLAPEPYDLIRPIEVVVRPVEGAFVASFFDANVSATGDTPEEAVANAKDMIVATFEALSEHKEDQLGTGLAEQRAVLRQFIRRPE